MPRRNRTHRPRVSADDHQPRGGSVVRIESDGDGDWLVRQVPGVSATKMYRCPGCDHEIRPGTPHVVVWPADEKGSVTDRRHWHTGCWAARHRRGPGHGGGAIR